jgi:hypothetical protein
MNGRSERMDKKMNVKDYNDLNDKFLAFMFSMDNPLEREIMRYIYKNQNVISHDRLIYHFCSELVWCDRNRLDKRLISLVNFGFLCKEVYKGIVIYTVVPDKKNGEDIKNMSKRWC